MALIPLPPDRLSLPDPSADFYAKSESELAAKYRGYVPFPESLAKKHQAQLLAPTAWRAVVDAVDRLKPHFPPDEDSPLAKAWRNMSGRLPGSASEFIKPPVPAEPNSPLARGEVAGMGAASPVSKALQAAKVQFPPEPGSPLDKSWQEFKQALRPFLPWLADEVRARSVDYLGGADQT
jgi:hypothetical protein